MTRLLGIVAFGWLAVIGALHAPTLTAVVVAAAVAIVVLVLVCRLVAAAVARRRFRVHARLRARPVAPVHSLYPAPLPTAPQPDAIDRELLQSYWTSRSIDRAASAAGVERDEAQARLITLLLDSDGAKLATRRERPLAPAERQAVIRHWEAGLPLARIAERLGRSPWFISAALLERPVAARTGRTARLAG